jgi:LL-diaminopimelate aminotransferase
MEKIQNEKKAQGVDLISLSIGDPDLPPPQFVLDALKEEGTDKKNHNYSFSQGEPDFWNHLGWYKKRFNVDIKHDEVVALMGSKEGLANIGRAFINPGDHVLCPDPAYPVYANGSTILCDGTPVPLPLLAENGFRPDFEAVDARRIRLCI